MRQRLVILAVVAIAAILMAVSAESKEATSMNSPSPERAQREHALQPEEINELLCTPPARNIASKYPGVVLKSENVSHDDTFGYIYRYDLVKVVDRKSGGVLKLRTVLVLWTQDRKTFNLATYPVSRDGKPPGETNPESSL